MFLLRLLVWMLTVYNAFIDSSHTMRASYTMRRWHKLHLMCTVYTRVCLVGYDLYVSQSGLGMVSDVIVGCAGGRSGIVQHLSVKC